MMTFMNSARSKSSGNRIVAFARDRDGMSAVEFALIMPMMIVLFFGTIEISSAFSAHRKVSMAAQTLADLTSRSTSVKDTDIANFRVILNAMITPFSTTPLKATVTQLYIDPNSGVARAQWSKGDVPITQGAPVAIPAALIGRDLAGKILVNQYLIYSTVSYQYVPAVGQVIVKSGVKLDDTSYTRPRQSDCVKYPLATSACTTY